MSAPRLPEGPLVAFYGDDFTGTAATMEVLSFAGLPTAIFLQPPSPEQLARFGRLRGIGIAGTARTESPEEMARSLPPLFRALAATKAPILHYKICSTLDSAPHIGSVGKAMELAVETLGSTLLPLYPCAVPMRRYQAFGQLFASAPDGVFRLDRHPVMSRHPVTPMDEADVARHVARQTDLPIQLVDLEALYDGRADQAFAPSEAVRVLSLDSVSRADQTEVGRLLWQARGAKLMAIGSQGIEYALVSYWQAAGLIPPASPPPSVGDLGPIAVVSGSVSPITAAQIADAAERGFALVLAEAADLAAGDTACEERATHAMITAIRAGKSAVLATARGPEDPAVQRYRDWTRASNTPESLANPRIGSALGRILRSVIAETGIRRAVISGGDTSGYAARVLGVEALEALTPTIPGASICKAHASDPLIDGLQLALKGGQMGTVDFFDWVRSGGGAR